MPREKFEYLGGVKASLAAEGGFTAWRRSGFAIVIPGEILGRAGFTMRYTIIL
jgi:hypothetical protein